MTVDIIIHTPDVFYQVCDTCSIPSDISQKYEDLFASYECFSKSTGATTTPHIFNKSKVSRSYQNDGDRRRKEYTLRLHEKPLHKALMGVLNILNNTNYTKVLTKIKILSSSSNIDTICGSIIKKGITEPMYCSLFVKLLDDIAHSLSYEKEVTKAVNDFIQRFVSSELVFANSPLHTDEYVKFCAEQKHKTNTTSANAFVLQLYTKTTYICMPITEYITQIWEMLNIYTNSETWDEFHVDLLLHLMIDTGKAFRQVTKQYADVLTKLSKQDHIKKNIKICFLTETLLSTVGSGKH